ncbi:MAG: carboxypeptidase regulatory-like domain-containing protein [Bryobacteraceae bacterium]|nr:carboxypeptidase regulatory-like domain-containing protein [Bryobacteraceae bacterium]
MIPAVLILAATLLAPLPSNAQLGLSRLSGNVTDPQGRSAAAAVVRATNLSNAAVREARTSEAGAFLFPSLSPGSYRVNVDLQGFAPYENPSVDVPIHTPTTLNVSLKLAGAAETFAVYGQASPLNTTDATIANSFSSWQITQLPLELRNVTALLSLRVTLTSSSEPTSESPMPTNGIAR